MAPNATKPHDRVVFLDRDGVINEPPPPGGWVLRWADFAFGDGVLAALCRLREEGFTVVVITNQSCIGRGLAAASDIEGINARMAKAVAAAGGRLAGVYVCPHAPADGCPCRKPKPGLIDRAAAELGLRPERGFVVGDSEGDVEAGLARGCTTVLVADPRAEARAETRAHHVVGSLTEAVDLILGLVGKQ